MYQSINKYFILILVLSACLLLIPSYVYADPASDAYQLKDYSFGNGGGESDSDQYSIYGVSGENGSQTESDSYSIGEGMNFRINANVPGAPTFTNPDSYYNKLRVVLNNGGNPSDTTFAIAISTDNFSTDTKYIQSDQTVSNTLGSEDWQTYTGWGGASGFLVIGLDPGVTYTIKVSARQGNYSQSAFGPTAQASTSNPTLVFDIDVASSNTESSAPYNVSIGELVAPSVTTATNKVWVDLDTNAGSGGSVYVSGTNGGLLSSAVNYTIVSTTGNLTSSTEGYGAKGHLVAETAGGPMEILSPYDGAGEVVGILDTAKRLIFDSSGAAVTGGRAAFEIKAKASSLTKAANDYSDTLSITAAASF